MRTEDRVAAESLFTEGRQLLQAGDYSRACAKLEASRRLEPALGTSLNLADCWEKLGRTASAWAEFKSAAAEAQKRGDSLRKDTALKRAAALEPRLSRLRVDVSEPGVSVLRNDEPLSPAVIGSSIPVDPGEYRIEASASGKRPWSRTVKVLVEGGVVSVSVPKLVDEPAAPPPAAESPAEAIPPPAPEPPPPQDFTATESLPLSEPPPADDGGRATQRTLAWVLGGVGVASVGVGAIFGGLAASSWSKAKDSCTAFPYGCTPEGVDDADTASSRATVATLGIVLGAAALGTSVVLFVLSADEPEGAAVAVGPGSVQLRGSF